MKEQDIVTGDNQPSHDDLLHSASCRFHRAGLLDTALGVKPCLNYDRKRREAQNRPMSRATKAWTFFLGANLIAFAGFILGVIASRPAP